MSVKIKVLFASTKLAKNNSKWIIDLNIRAKTINHLEENIGVNL